MSSAYQLWIERERKIRIELLNTTLTSMKKKVCHICRDCGEVCLCHEENCSNCDSSNISLENLTVSGDEVIEFFEKRIRCCYRFMHLSPL
jgi:uncharacterized OB-fold protein